MAAIPVRYRRAQKAQFIQKLQHAIPSVVVIGATHGHIAAWGDRRLELRVDDTGISVPGRVFHRLTLAWHDVAEISIGPATARVIAVDGRDQSLDLSDAVNSAAIRHALADAQARVLALQAAEPMTTG